MTRRSARDDLLACLSPIQFDHINFLGRYVFTRTPAPAHARWAARTPPRSSEPAARAGRLEAFSDGVFAVAITLLALNLAIGGPGPHQPTLAAKLADHWPAFAAYAVSFATIRIIWVNHHALFRNISEIDRTLLFVNLLGMPGIFGGVRSHHGTASGMPAGSPARRSAAPTCWGPGELLLPLPGPGRPGHPVQFLARPDVVQQLDLSPRVIVPRAAP